MRKIRKSHDWNWRNWSKWPFLGQNDNFWAKMAKTRFFRQNPKTSLPYTHEATTLCKKLEKSYERILRSSSNGWMNESEFIGPKSAARGTN